MKRVSKTRWFVWLLLLVAVGCTQTEVEEDNIPLHALKEVEAGFNLKVLATRAPVTRSITFTPDGTIEADTLTVGVKDSLQTKAAAALTTEQESAISELWVGQYDATKGTLLSNQHLSSLTETTVTLKLKQNLKDSQSHVYFVANAGDLGKIADEKTLKEHTLDYKTSADGLPTGSLCKMVGMWQGAVDANGMKNITVDLTRLLAKITFKYSIGDDFTFTPSSVSLKNAPTLSQVEAPKTQLAAAGYTSYTGTANKEGATIYWYLPENMAGTASGENAVDSEKKKTGKGVTDATCIELTGEAEQGGVTYKDVTFRFYPGSDKSNYDIIRNSHYTMTVTLVGIDISDERITVGTIPDIVIDTTAMLANKGAEKTVQITTRPGQPWEFQMPDWLSAQLGETTISAGGEIKYQGPADLVFTAETANPKAEKRSASFKVKVNDEEKNITITQAGSTLTGGTAVELAAATGSEGSSTFTATEGLPWLAALGSTGDWLDWSDSNSATSGSEAPAEAQPLLVKTTAGNPSSSPRTGTITVKGGASTTDDIYTGLKQEITVNQAGSTLSVSGAKTIAATVSSDNTSTFTATAGLSWNVGVATTDTWLSLTGTTSGTDNTTGKAQTITYSAVVNPNATTRQGTITVKAGNAVSGTDAGLTKTIAVTQSGSTFTVSKTELSLAGTRDTGTVEIEGTKGLPWTVSPSVETNGIKPDSTSSTIGDAVQTLKFIASKNTGEERTATFTIAVTGGNHSKTVKVTQAAAPVVCEVTIDQVLADAYKAAQSDLKKYPPFNYDGGTVSGTTGSDYKGASSTVTISTPYTVEVESTQSPSVYRYDDGAAKNYCTTKGEGWRLPTIIELFGMWTKCKGTNNSATDNEAASTALGDKFIGVDYWSSSVYNGTSVCRCRLNFYNGNFNGYSTYNGYYVRCVRDKTE